MSFVAVFCKNHGIFCRNNSTKVVHSKGNIGSANPMVKSVFPSKGFPHFGLSQLSKTNSLTDKASDRDVTKVKNIPIGRIRIITLLFIEY